MGKKITDISKKIKDVRDKGKDKDKKR